MAEQVTIAGQIYTRRNPLAVIGLTFITLGIYGLVWYYKANDEARRYLRDESIRPGIALLAVALGWVLIVPPFISIYHTGERVLRMEEQAGVQQQISPALGLILGIVVGLFSYAYFQEHLNRVWSTPMAELPSPAAQLPSAPADPPPPPPPPAP